jgi:hypothetical protein
MSHRRFHTRMYHGGRVVPDVTWHEDPATPAEILSRRRKLWRTLLVLGLILILAGIVYWRFVPEITRDYTDIGEHFKYGSIGTEMSNGVPYWIWKVLPEMFSEYLLDGGKEGYASLGFIIEKDASGKPCDTPVGFAIRRIEGVDRVSINCAACHSSTYRETPKSDPTLVLGMPAHRLNLLGYFDFLFRCAGDPRFNTGEVMARIDARTRLGPLERIIYEIAIPLVKQELVRLRPRTEFLLQHPSGTGRIDTFTPYKGLVFHFPDSRYFAVGNVDFPSIWNQGPREGLQLHWDGNNTSVHERNISAAIGAGATPTSLDLPRLKRIEDWLRTFPAPSYPGKIDEALANKGEALYRTHCATCHGILKDGKFEGELVGKVDPIDRIGTDRERLDSYSLDLMMNQFTLGAGQDWRFKFFRKTNGYANQPLDGIWARAPYLHNGAVPTLRDLLEPPAKRPKTFYRGYDVLDQEKVGFVCTVAEEGGRHFSRFDTSVKGNGNGGHEYGTDLAPADKNALIEFMKKL